MAGNRSQQLPVEMMTSKVMQRYIGNPKKQ